MAQPPETYKVRLSPVPVEAKTRADITGIGSATATLEGAKLSIAGSFEGLQSPAFWMPRSIRGPLPACAVPQFSISRLPMRPAAPSTPLLDLTPQQIESLKKGKLYIQIDSEKAPDGKLVAWLLR